MSVVVTGVQVHNNPTTFTNPFQFEVYFDCLHPGIKEALEWKVVYAADPTDEQKDQELECVMVGPVTVGQNRFLFEADAPDHTLIAPKDLIGMTVVLLKGLYKDEEFTRVGYYVNNQFTDPSAIQVDENGVQILPSTIDPASLTRTIVNEPRVTRRIIAWDSAETVYAAPPAGDTDAAAAKAMGDDDVLDLDALPEVGEGDAADDEEMDDDEETGEAGAEVEIEVPVEDQY